jgi:tetratricopeptide (TPR) repeat protein
VDRFRVWGPRAIAGAGFAAYALLAPPGPYWLDSSELAAAGVRLGSPPSTGFPLICMLAKLASLLPAGELAFRVHLASAVCAALAMLWTARLVEASAGRGEGTPPGFPRTLRDQGLGRRVAEGTTGVIGGMAAAALLGATLAFARQATIGEVYAPTAALLAATALLFDRVARGGDARAGLLLALTVGLGLGAHVSYRLLVPIPVLLLLWVRLRRGARWPLVAPLVALSVGAALHLYLPVRSATGSIAAVDQEPRDAGALAQLIAGTVDDDAMSMQPEVIEQDAARFLGGMADQIGVLGLMAALAGAASLLLERRSRWLLVLLAACAIGDAILAAWVLPAGIGERAGVLFALAVAALAGIGVAWLGRFAGAPKRTAVRRRESGASGGSPVQRTAVRKRDRGAAGGSPVGPPRQAAVRKRDPGASGDSPVGTRAGPAAAAVAGVMLAIGPGLVAWPELRAAAASDAPRAYAEAALDATPPRGQLLSRGESLSALVLFLTAAEGARPDATALDRSRLGARAFDRLSGAAWELGDDPVPTLEMRSAVGVLASSGASTGGADIARAAGRLAGIFAGSAGDSIARRIAADALTRLGRLAGSRGDPDLALRLLDAATSLRPAQAQAWLERGALLSRLGRHDAAARSTERALAFEPNRVAALLDAARYRLALGDAERALAHAERAVRLQPGAPAAWTLAALADARAGRAARARERLTRALTLDPDREDARAALRSLSSER